MSVVERTRVSQVTPANTRHSPRNGFAAYFALSPAIGFLATVTPEKLASHELDASVEASGPHDFAVRIRRSRQQHRQRPPHPAPRFVTIASRPSCRVGTGRACKDDLPDMESGLFFTMGLDRFLLICPSGRCGQGKAWVSRSQAWNTRQAVACVLGLDGF
jgi:hypothetical protein